jgi:transmembrane sensor
MCEIPPSSDQSPGGDDSMLDLAIDLELERILTGTPLVLEHDFSADLPNGSARQAVAVRLGAFPGENGDSKPLEPTFRRESGTRYPTLSTWNRSSRFLTAGAGLTLALLGGFFAWKSEHTTPPIQRFATTAAQRSTIHLKDGSAILLAPSTSITVMSREVTVSGEAYFTVAPHASQPFIVRTAHAVTRVLGTRFGVREYPGERATRVVVTDGRVAVEAVDAQIPEARSHILTALTAAYVSDSGVAVQKGAGVNDYTAWTQGRLVFNERPLREVVGELSRAYGIDIRVADSALARQPMTFATSVRDVPLSQVLTLLTFTIDAHYSRRDSAFVIAPGRGVREHPTPKYHSQPEKQYGR